METWCYLRQPTKRPRFGARTQEPLVTLHRSWKIPIPSGRGNSLDIYSNYTQYIWVYGMSLTIELLIWGRSSIGFFNICSIIFCSKPWVLGTKYGCRQMGFLQNEAKEFRDMDGKPWFFAWPWPCSTVAAYHSRLVLGTCKSRVIHISDKPTLW